MCSKINTFGIKKISILILISIFVVSCGETKNSIGNVSENNKQSNIVNTKNSEDNLVGKNVSGKNKNDIIGTGSLDEDIKQEIHQKPEITEEQLQKDNQFVGVNRNKQKKLAEKIDCKKEFKTDYAIQECLWSQADLAFDKYQELEDEKRLQYNCSNLLTLPKTDEYYKRYYNICLDEKKEIRINLEKEKLFQKIKNADLSYCNSKIVQEKKGFDLDKCKISVIAHSNKKDCNILPSNLRDDCEEIKAEVLKIEAEKARKKKLRDIMELGNL